MKESGPWGSPRNQGLEHSKIHRQEAARNIGYDPGTNMNSSKKRTPAKTVGKLRDLKSKKNPKGGKLIVNVPNTTPVQAFKPAQTNWVEDNSFSFGASNP
jgi:hypothetical protein